ncbi:MAG: sigma-54 factor interaction domain-containing protein, partial [Verrucomicrobia bacterium]|nr:sigma-54 factor interaction domain-containing protein [Verrucomicrobiota bacterium]
MIYSDSECREAEDLVRIIYCNPFLEERQHLNRKVLGKDFESAKVEIDNSLAQNPNAGRLNQRCESLLAKGRTIISKLRNPERHRQFYLYEHLVYFFLYHRLALSMDKYILNCIQKPDKNVPWDSFTDLQNDYDHYLFIGNRNLEAVYSKTELASFLFQIYRAFYHTQSALIGKSDAMTQLRARVWNSIFTHDMKRYLRSLFLRMENVFTLITGPSGSGKELVARAIGFSRFIPFDEHTRKFSSNYSQVFYPINLSALSETLIESELFGHQKGAFTGALQNRAGYFESCGPYGTVFLDEIGDTDPSVQVKLLRVLQTRQFQRLGDTKPRPFEGKVMAATNRDLAREMQEGRFREDFYYRLCADRIETPPLVSMLHGNRYELDLLVSFVAEKIAGPMERDNLTGEVTAWIRNSMPKGYGWPGNFRELEQCVRNVMVHGEYSPQQERPVLLDSETQSSPTLNQWIRLLVNREFAKTPNLAQ